MIFQLPNGQWVDTSVITRVNAFTNGNRVVVHIGPNDTEVIFTESHEEAERIRDEIGNKVLEAQRQCTHSKSSKPA